jgi:hypothetical protein
VSGIDDAQEAASKKIFVRSLRHSRSHRGFPGWQLRHQSSTPARLRESLAFTRVPNHKLSWHFWPKLAISNT